MGWFNFVRLIMPIALLSFVALDCKRKSLYIIVKTVGRKGTELNRKEGQLACRGHPADALNNASKWSSFKGVIYYLFTKGHFYILKSYLLLTTSRPVLI